MLFEHTVQLISHPSTPESVHVCWRVQPPWPCRLAKAAGALRCKKQRTKLESSQTPRGHAEPSCTSNGTCSAYYARTVNGMT